MKCKYFEILFSEKYSDNKEETIMFKDVSYTSLNETVRYIYTGKCIFESFDDLINCYVFANRIEYIELEKVILDMIDPMKINKDDDMKKNIKKLPDIKNINEEVIYKKITMLLNKKEYLEDDNEMQKDLDKINNYNGNCDIYFNDKERIWYSFYNACRFIEKEEYMKFNSFKKINKSQDIYLFPDLFGKTSKELINEYSSEICTTQNKDWNHGKECIFYSCKFLNKVYTKKVLYEKYNFLKKYKIENMFEKYEKGKVNFYYLKYNNILLEILKDEIKNMEKMKYLKY